MFKTPRAIITVKKKIYGGNWPLSLFVRVLVFRNLKKIPKSLLLINSNNDNFNLLTEDFINETQQCAMFLYAHYPVRAEKSDKKVDVIQSHSLALLHSLQ